MEIAIWILIGLCLTLGFLGCFINKVPGPLAVLVALLLMKFGIDKIDPSWLSIIVTGTLVIANKFLAKQITEVAQEIQEFGKGAVIGTTIGSILGIFTLYAMKEPLAESIPLLIVGILLSFFIIPYLFAFILELKKGASVALKSAFAATLVYLVNTGLKLFIFGLAIYMITQTQG